MLRHLLSPGRIGNLELRNRIVMAPMGSNLAESDGHAGERIQRYYEARARGGAGLLIVGVGAVSYPAGAAIPRQVAVSDDAFLPGLTELARRAHEHGARIALQLQHAGKVSVRDIAEGRPLLVPSLPAVKGANDLLRDLTAEERQAFVANLSGGPPSFRVATAEDLRALIADFAAAAERVRRAGFDAVELHAGHGYVLSAFLSPAWNTRDDEWGGPLENRARLLCETLRAVKARAGVDFPVWCRIDATEFRTAGGIRFEDAVRTAELAQEAGADAIHVSAYADATSGVGFTDAPLVHREGGYVDFAAGVKRRVEVPVIAVGRIEPAQADRLIGDGRADFVAMGRKLLADPELPRKLVEGRPEDVRPCIYCYTCVAQIFLDRSVVCAVNPTTGRELEPEFRLEPAPSPRRLLVVGAGPAGLEAARVAALRGHRVTLCEKRSRLGGTLFFASLVHPPNERLLRWLETQVRKAGVEVRLRTEVTRADVEALAPDAVVWAVGGTPLRMDVPGADQPHVLDGDDLRALLEAGPARGRSLPFDKRLLLAAGRLLGVPNHLAWARRFARRWMPLGPRVVVLGGGLVGVELAAFLVERGRQVTVLEPGPSLAASMAPPRRWRALHELRERGVALYTGARVLAIEPDAVRYCADGTDASTIPADSVILAGAVGASAELADALLDLDIEQHRIGDARGVGWIEGAIRDGARIARLL